MTTPVQTKQEKLEHLEDLISDEYPDSDQWEESPNIDADDGVFEEISEEEEAKFVGSDDDITSLFGSN